MSLLGKPAPSSPKTDSIGIGKLTAFKKNARHHGSRNIGMITDSLRELGPGRSILIDEDNTILAGHGVVSAAKKVGIDKVVVIDVPEDSIVAVRRTNLTEKQKTDMMLRDNRAGELGSWDANVMADLKRDGVQLAHLFTTGEMDEIVKPSAGSVIVEDSVPDMALQPSERYNYVVLLFKEDLGWQRAVEVLGLKKEAIQHGTTRKVGIGRLVDGNKVLDRIK